MERQDIQLIGRFLTWLIAAYGLANTTRRLSYRTYEGYDLAAHWHQVRPKDHRHPLY
jgi:hypothetical protein